jgi:hypothetical protein
MTIARPEFLRIGYHRVSDNSITSAWLPIKEFDERNAEVSNDSDINHVWARDAHMNLIWERFQ